MYKRKFPKASKTGAAESASTTSQSRFTASSSLTNSSPSVSTPDMSIVNNHSTSDDDDSPESPSMLREFDEFPAEKKRKTVQSYAGDTTDCSQPLFDDAVVDNAHSFLKQTLKSCGLHLERDQNILCKYLPGAYATST